MNEKNLDAICRWQSPVGELTVLRHAPDPTRSLRAWDTADELLLQTLLETGQPGKALILNDEYGALTMALASHQQLDQQPVLPQAVLCVNDLYDKTTAIKANLAASGLHVPVVAEIPENHAFEFTHILMRLPRSLALLQAQLHQLREISNEGTQLACSVMSKYLTRNMVELINRTYGAANVSLAVRKARVVTAVFDATLTPAAPAPPATVSSPWLTESLQVAAGVFSHDRIDPGSDLLCRHIPSSEEPGRIIDVGCGAGLLGLVAASRNPNADLVLIDNSAIAVATAASNAHKLFADRSIQVRHGDALKAEADHSATLVLCNPPFHDNHRVTSATAESMIQGAHRVLRAGGKLLLVGNRHLQYQRRIQ